MVTRGPESHSSTGIDSAKPLSHILSLQRLCDSNTLLGAAVTCTWVFRYLQLSASLTEHLLRPGSSSHMLCQHLESLQTATNTDVKVSPKDSTQKRTLGNLWERCPPSMAAQRQPEDLNWEQPSFSLQTCKRSGRLVSKAEPRAPAQLHRGLLAQARWQGKPCRVRGSFSPVTRHLLDVPRVKPPPALP